jgi:AraC-like DNA-binding protein
MKQSKQKALFYSSDKRSLYVGRLERMLTRVNVSSTLLLSIDHTLDLHDKSTGQIHSSRSLLIPGGSNVSIDTHNANVAVCFLDDLNTDLSKIIPKMDDSVVVNGQSRVYSNISHESEIINSAENIWTQRSSISDVVEEVDSWVEFFNSSNETMPDPRVAQAIAIIKKNCSENISVADVAQQVNLSAPRLTQLFKEVTGTPIRRFRLWHRIYMTALKIREGLSLTDAAIFSGFSDYAQFSRVYRELGGGSPSAARNNTEIRALAA